MSMQSFEFDESTIHPASAMERPASGNARARRKEEKRNSSRINGSPYGANVVNPRQAWLNSMNQGQSFNNMASSGYGLKDPISPPSKPRAKPVHRASHLDKEEMYDEIQRLKELVAAFTKEKSLRQTRITKLEKELNKKDKLLEQTYSQTQSTYGPVSERSYGSTSIETNSTITGLRQKCHKYECLLRDKENEIKTMKSDLKSTRLQELEIMCDTYYQEITRLTQVMEQKPGHMTPTRVVTPRASTPIHSSEKEKILEAKLQKLEVDNATLKKQIMKTTTQSVGDTTGLISEYASLSRAELEEKHQQITKELFDAKLTIDELKTSSAVSEETIKQLKSQQTKNKENLEKLADDRGTLERKLASVDGEHQAQKLVIRRLNKTVRQHEDEVEKLKKQSDKEQGGLKMRLTDKTKIITKLEREVQDLKDQIAEFEIKVTKIDHKKVASRSKKVSSQVEEKDATPVIIKEKVEKVSTEKPVKKVESEAEPDREIKKSESEVQRETKRRNVKISEEEKRKVKEDEAARKIQKNFRNHSLVSSVSILQRVLRGHALRCKVAKQEHNESAEILQSTLKGFAVKSQHLESLKKEQDDLKVVAEKREALRSAPVKTKNSTGSKIQKPEVKKTQPVTKNPDAVRKTKKVEPSPKTSLKTPDSKQADKKSADKNSSSADKNSSSGKVSDRNVPAYQLEPSTDEDDLIMM